MQPRAARPARRCRPRRTMTGAADLRDAASAPRSLPRSSGVDERVDLVEADDLGLVGQPVAIGLELARGSSCRRPTTSSCVPSTRWSSTPQRSTWPRKRSPRPAPSCAPSIRPGMSASTNSVSSHAHHAELRLQRGEGIVGDLRLARPRPPRGTSTCRHWAGRPGRHRRSASAAARPSALRPASRDRRGAARWLVEDLNCALPQPPSPPCASSDALARPGQVGEHRLLVVVEDLRADRHA